jgi:hypothetical protein
MTKRVELGPASYRWVLRHRFTSEEKIIGTVMNCPSDERIRLDDDRFQIEFKRRKNGKFVKIILWVHERSSTFYVYKIHSIKV